MSNWWESQSNLGALADYMARTRNDSGRTIAEAMCKPWNWGEVWTEFLTALDFEGASE